MRCFHAVLRAPLLACAILAAAPLATHAAEPPAYLDDRSTPASLVQSLYNAISRKEYARAYSYFDQGVTSPYDEYAAGFSTTDSVDVAIGNVTQEGAAGSIYSSVPVAVRAHMSDGTSKTFAGCYWLRLAQPTIQTPPFTPLHIRKAKLAPASSTDALAKLLPATCPDE